MGVRGITALAGFGGAATTVASVALYFVYAGPPPAENVLTRGFISLVTFACLMVFMAGLNTLVKRDGVAGDFALSLSQTAGVLFVGVSLVALANEAGVAFAAPDGSLDPTTDGPLAAANILFHGSIKRLLTAVYLVSMSSALLRSGVLPRWVARLGLLIGAVNVAFIPAMFFGTDVTRFYSAHGWGNSALTGSLVIWWVLAASLALLRPAQAAPTARPAPAGA
ncbi:MAG: hypothetical protein ABW360_16725 [Phenylobacterium sp.]